MSVQVNFIGAGRVGQTLAYLLQEKKLIQLKAICNTSLNSSLHATQFIGEGTPIASLTDLPLADIIFITTPDDAIQAVCDALAQNQMLKEGNIVLHCSGVLSSDVLSSAAAQGCFTASVHPLRSFADPSLSVTTYSGTYSVVEGHSEAVEKITELFKEIGSIVVPIDKNQKKLYHVAGVFASNYLVTLAHVAEQCLMKSGIPELIARDMRQALMQSTLTNLQTMQPPQALTGPIKRSDVSTIQSHIEALQTTEWGSLYTALGKETVDLVDLNSDKQACLKHLFQRDSF